jgi:NADPH2:quinone reductase
MEETRLRAQQVHGLDGPSGLRLVDVEEPEDSDRVVIEVAGAGVSFPDLLLTRGEYQMKPPLPFVPGVEVAGSVRSAPLGSGFRAGDRVMAFTMLGGFADVAVADPAFTLAIPAGLSIEAASGFVMNYHTAHFALARRARVRAGERVAIHGAAGGIGTAAIQVARGLGAEVIAIAAGPDKMHIAERAGAHRVLDAEGDWVSALRAQNDGHGVNAILDPVGGERFDLSLRCLAPEGRLIVVGFTDGRVPSVQVNRVLLRNIDIVGAAWGAFLGVEPSLFGETQRQLNTMIQAGTIAPIVGKTYPLEEAEAALTLLGSRQATGKIVLHM